jgi:GT2 family glycosyltransferase
LLGEKPYAELPRYLQGFDVACIPFLHNDLTRATNPVKFFEYLSAGKPVVAVDLQELIPYREHFYPVRTTDEFVPAIERALAEDCEAKAKTRRTFAAGHTWEARYEELTQAVDSSFGLVSIIIVSYHNLGYLRLCLESIRERTIYPNYEIVVVDNASDPEVVEYLEREAEGDPRLRLIANEQNVGFAAANNQGIEVATSAEYVVLLNNDTIVTTGWLCGLLRHFVDPDVGMVGPVTNSIGNEAKIDVPYSTPAEIEEFAYEHTARHDGRRFDIAVLAMFCVAIRKSLVDRIGKLDERFHIGMFEDDDYSLRVQEAGYRTICAEDVFVHHWGRASFAKMKQPEYEAVFAANKEKFEAKWGRPWEPHRYRPPATRARQRSAGA